MSAAPAFAGLAELFGSAPVPAFTVVRADHDPALRRAYLALRHRAFVEEQGLFAGHDLDDHDTDPACRILVAVAAGGGSGAGGARGAAGAVLGGVRLHPVGDDATLGWWRGSRLVCAEPPRERSTHAPSPARAARRGAIGAALVRAACEEAVAAGALRFDAHVQERHAGFFARLGWRDAGTVEAAGAPHRAMRWDVPRLAQLAARTKGDIGPLTHALLADAGAAGALAAGFLGDDGVPVPGPGGLIAATDAILPAMVERDPEWAGWCGMLVTAHDLAAMGAEPVGALDALGARDAAHAERIVRGLRAGADAFALPILGGHTTLNAAAGSLAVTGLGRTDDPVPASGGRPGDAVSVCADLEGAWRPGYGRTQWDSTTRRSRAELAAMLGGVARHRPHAAKDVSMAGVVGTAGMLAEASGCGIELDVAAIPRPAGVGAADWLTCFPGFATVTADAPDAPPPADGPARGARCGVLTREPGVRLRWPDGTVTTVLAESAVTGLGPADRSALDRKDHHA